MQKLLFVCLKSHEKARLEEYLGNCNQWAVSIYNPCYNHQFSQSIHYLLTLLIAVQKCVFCTYK